MVAVMIFLIQNGFYDWFQFSGKKGGGGGGGGGGAKLGLTI